jgi:hypothetical protein
MNSTALVLIATLVVTLHPAFAGAQEQNLQQEINALKEGQHAIQKDRNYSRILSIASGALIG